MQVSSMQREIRRTVTLHSLVSQTQGGQDLARQRTANIKLLRKCRHLRKRFVQTPCMQDPDHIRAELNACPDFPER